MDDQRRIPELADMHQQVPRVGPEPDWALRQREADAHIWVFHSEDSNDGRDKATAEPKRSNNSEMPGDIPFSFRQTVAKLGDILDNSLSPSGEELPLIRQPKVTRR